MDNRGTLIRRLRMIKGMAPQDLVQGISSLSYLSLMEQGKRPVSNRIFIKLLNRLGIGVQDGTKFDYFSLIPEAVLELVNAHRQEGFAAQALEVGESYLKTLVSDLDEIGLATVRLRGSLMNSALENGDFAKARDFFSMDLPQTTPEMTFYSHWTSANFFEQTGDMISSASFLKLALENASAIKNESVVTGLKVSYINNKLQAGNPPESDDYKFLVKVVNNARQIEDWSLLALTNMALAWYSACDGNLPQARKLIREAENLIPMTGLHLMGSLAESAADLCLEIHESEMSKDFLGKVLEQIETSDSRNVKALIWKRLGRASVKAKALTLVERCESEFMLLTA